MKIDKPIEIEKERITKGNEAILNEVVVPYLKTKICECGHGADKHMKDMICDECGCNEWNGQYPRTDDDIVCGSFGCKLRKYL